MLNKFNKHMKTAMIQKTGLALAITLSCCTNTWAQDSNLRSDSIHYGDDGWDISLGLGVGVGKGDLYVGEDDSDVQAAILGGITYRKDRFFFAADDDKGIQIGYSLIQKEDWVIDAVFGPVFGTNFDDNDELKHLDDRDIDGHLGARYSWYGENNRISFGIGQDVLNAHDGWLATAQYSHEWQIKNWLVTGSAGAAHISEKMANHIVGVSAAEATSSIPAFSADAGNVGWIDLKAEYPVTENWVLQTSLNMLAVSDEFNDSPITDDDTTASLIVGMKYQF